MSSATTLTTPQEQVDSLILQIARRTAWRCWTAQPAARGCLCCGRAPCAARRAAVPEVGGRRSPAPCVRGGGGRQA